METVPVDFCERVSALRRCCGDLGVHIRCWRALPVFEAAKWGITEPIAVTFHLKVVGGRWKYGFTNPDYSRGLHTPWLLTLDELAERKDLMFIRINKVEICKLHYYHPSLKSLDVHLEKLLEFTSRLMDEPELSRLRDGVEVFENTEPDGAVVRKWIEEGWFREISLNNFTAADQSLLDKRRKGGEPTQISMLEVNHDGDRVVLQEYLKSGKSCRVVITGLIIPFEVMEAIVEKFGKNQEEYTQETLSISAYFDDTTKGKLEEMFRNGRCHYEGGSYLDRWVFEGGEKSLCVEYFPRFTGNSYRILTDKTYTKAYICAKFGRNLRST